MGLAPSGKASPWRYRPAPKVTQAMVLSFLRDHAEAGLRCPTNEEINDALGTMTYSVTPCQLARLGLLKLEVWAHNYRVVEIDGKRTAPSPIGRAPYKVVG